MNFGRWLGFVVLILSLYILWAIREILLIVFTAVIFATALNRLVRHLEKYKIKRKFGVGLIFILAIVITLLFFWLVAPPFVDQFQRLIELLPKIWETFRSQIITIQAKNYEWLPAPPSLSDLITQLQPLTSRLVTNFFSFFSGFLIVTLKLTFLLVLMLLMLIDPQTYRQVFLQLFPSFYRRRADEILSLSEIAIVNWLGGTLINCMFIGLLSAIGLWFLQVKLVLVHGLLAGLLNFIPNIGPTASVIFPIMIALLDAPWKILAILIWYLIVQNIESYLLTPTVMAKQVSLLPAVTLLAQIFFASVFGVLGLLLALPLTVVAKTWVEELLFKDILDQWQGVKFNNKI
jgi:predicted PurR-regulated permease PerM